MKRFRHLLILAVSAVLAVSALAFAGCDGEEGKALSGSMKIVITPDAQAQATVIEADLSNFTDKNSVMDVIDSLAEAGKICYKGSNGVYGMYLTALGVPVESTYEGQTTTSSRRTPPRASMSTLIQAWMRTSWKRNRMRSIRR